MPENSGITICLAHVVGCSGGGAQGRDRDIVELDHSFHYHQQQHGAASLLQSFLPRLSGPPFAISHLKFPSGFVPSCLFLNTNEKGDCLTSHHVLTVCTASGAVYEAIHIVS